MRRILIDDQQSSGWRVVVVPKNEDAILQHPDQIAWFDLFIQGANRFVPSIFQTISDFLLTRDGRAAEYRLEIWKVRVPGLPQPILAAVVIPEGSISADLSISPRKLNRQGEPLVSTRSEVREEKQVQISVGQAEFSQIAHFLNSILESVSAATFTKASNDFKVQAQTIASTLDSGQKTSLSKILSDVIAYFERHPTEPIDTIALHNVDLFLEELNQQLTGGTLNAQGPKNARVQFALTHTAESSQPAKPVIDVKVLIRELVRRHPQDAGEFRTHKTFSGFLNYATALMPPAPKQELLR